MRLHAVKSLDGAIKLAVHHRLPALAEKMNQIKERKLYEPDEMDDIPSSFDIKSFIKDEMEKQKNDIVIASSFSLPDKPVTRTSQNYSSGPLDRVSDISSLDHSIDPVFPDTEGKNMTFNLQYWNLKSSCHRSRNCEEEEVFKAFESILHLKRS